MSLRFFICFSLKKNILHTYSPTSPEEKPFPWDYKKTDGDNYTSRTDLPGERETELPGSDRTELNEAGRTKLPGDEGTELPEDGGAEKPRGRAEESEAVTEQPGGGTEQPGAGTEHPGAGTEQPGGGTDTNKKEGRKGSRAVSQVEIEGSTPQVSI